jgi:hypothetical protein
MAANLKTELAAVPARVSEGVKWLEGEGGFPDWRDRLRESIERGDLGGGLEMQNCYRCVLGRLAGNFWSKVTFGFGDEDGPGKKMTEEEAVACGFHAPEFGSDRSYTAYYNALATEWRKRMDEQPATPRQNA